MKINILLVANRGEIACRIMRTCKNSGIRTVAVYSDADAQAPHVTQADEAILIGPAPVAESYLNIERILEAAKASGADAVHPGYGFLSENAEFASACVNAGLIFVGPGAEAIALMGNKAEAKRRMIEAGVPCVPGYEGRDQSESAFTTAAEAIGYPVMVKAAAGGGGRGMRLVGEAAQLGEALALARSEAENAFGSGELILEKAIVEPRHVEIQVFADNHGNVIHLGERDCSVQRRHQKVIEEAPSPAVDADLRERMGAAAVEAARAIGYCSAGTVEFLLDGDGKFYFLEMNTRLQVEHPVTEMVTGLDLVAMQIAVARGEPLPVSQEDVQFDGHAIEARLYAEDPGQGFLPSTGAVELWVAPRGEGIRVDSGTETGQFVSPHYDPMLAKIVASGDNRDAARRRLVAALGDMVLFGPASNRDFLIEALGRERFCSGDATTGFIAAEFANGVQVTGPETAETAIAAILQFYWRREQSMARAGLVSPQLSNWSSRGPIEIHMRLGWGGEEEDVIVAADGSDYRVSLGGAEINISLSRLEGNRARFRIDDRSHDVTFSLGQNAVFVATTHRTYEFRSPDAGSASRESSVSGGAIEAPMHGRLTEVLVSVGDEVATGDRLAVLEAMKMQHQITASVDGRVTAVNATVDDQVGADDVIIEIEVTEKT